MVIGDMLTRNANKFPEKPAIISDEVTLSYRKLNERVNSLANYLVSTGLKKGDRIGVLVHNSHQFVEI